MASVGRLICCKYSILGSVSVSVFLRHRIVDPHVIDCATVASHKLEVTIDISRLGTRSVVDDLVQMVGKEDFEAIS